MTLINSTIKIAKESSKIAISVGIIALIWKYGIPIESIKSLLSLMKKDTPKKEDRISVSINQEDDLVNKRIRELDLPFKAEVKDDRVMKIGSAVIGSFQFIKRNFSLGNRKECTTYEKFARMKEPDKIVNELKRISRKLDDEFEE